MENTQIPSETPVETDSAAKQAALQQAIAEACAAETPPAPKMETVVAIPEAAPAPNPVAALHGGKQVPMFRWRNTAPTTMTLTEGMIVVPAGGYTPPMMAPTPSLQALENAGLMVREEAMTLPASGIRAVTSGDYANDIPTTGVVKPVVAGPQYLAPAMQSPTEKLKTYADPNVNPAAHKLREAMANCVVSIGDTAIAAGESIDPEKASTMLKVSKNQQFADEVTVGDYVQDTAAEAIKAMRQHAVVATPPQAGVVPEGTPPELQAFFKKTHLQKKIAIFQSVDGEYLKAIRNFERDKTVVSCISQRLGELGIAD